MKISTRGRYAVRIMLDMAEFAGEEYIALKNVCARQGISFKYAENVMKLLVKGGLVEGAHGKGGGYKLKKSPENYSVGEILRITENELVPIACLDAGAKECPRAKKCKTLGMWRGFYKLTCDYFDKISLKDLMNEPQKVE